MRIEKRVSPERVEDIIAEAEEGVWEPFPGVTIVAWRLPNGFTISDQSGCVDPSKYDRAIGLAIARDHLKAKVWQLEGYLLTQRVFDAEGF
ncbi:MAG: Gp49 family protein [Berryella intestinalis]|uniref:Gp49 family protein n=1 Tax=Berryella intestinalis TaxID=1531429 RepID=UPI002A74D3E2|nr:Gp49 family protein [Berryella intestinalis]MDY3130010.1 Gp49 family protein [Berryella intestinalis]